MILTLFQSILSMTSSPTAIMFVRTRRNEKELKVKPATRFKCFQYLLTKN